MNSVVHWKLNHYGAILAERDGSYLVHDRTFSRIYGQKLWISKDAMDQEVSGYFLIPQAPLATGWREVSSEEGSHVWGKGATTGLDGDATTSDDEKSCPGNEEAATGMPLHSVHLMLVSLNIVDIPLGYTPPRGPAVQFRVTYNQRDPYSAAYPNYSNLGSKWTFDWFSYITDNGTGGSDPVTRYVSGGGLESITDPLGQTTTWIRDVQGRVSKKIYDDTSEVNYAYWPRSGRLASRTDALTPTGQVKNYVYNPDGTLKNISYDNEIIATADVDLTYDPNYRRLVTMTDGTGLTSFGYHPVTTGSGTLGATQLASVDGPLFGTSDKILFGYDELGRLLSRTINGVGESWIYDDLGRLTDHSTALGAFAYDYVGDTPRLDTLTAPAPNSQVTAFDYFDKFEDFRLKQIWNKTSGGATLSKFDYQHDALGRIRQWTQQADAGTPNVMDLEYDFEGQLRNALITPQGGSPAKGFAYAYDGIGNRLSEQIDELSPSVVSTVTESSYNAVNQLQAVSGTSPLPVSFRGTVDEPATVTVNGTEAQVYSAPGGGGQQVFNATIDLSTGNNTVTVEATDYGDPANMTSEDYSVDVVGGQARTGYIYDGNGNPTFYQSPSGNVSYEWDAEDRLVAINQGTLRSEFTYDGFGRRVKIVEKSGARPAGSALDIGLYKVCLRAARWQHGSRAAH